MEEGQHSAPIRRPPSPGSGHPTRPPVSISVSSANYPRGAKRDWPQGAITFKGHGQFFEDDASKAWSYRALSNKLNPDDPKGEAFFHDLLDSPLLILLAITAEKKIMYNAGLAAAHITGTVAEEKLGPRLSSDAERMNPERARRGLRPR